MTRALLFVIGAATMLALLVPTAWLGWMIGSMLLAWSRHLAGLLVVLAIVSVSGRRFVMSSVAFVAAVVAVMPWLSAPDVMPESPSPGCLGVVSVNAFERNRFPTADIAEALRASNADVLMIVEPRPGLITALEPLLVDYRVAVHHEARKKFDLAIFTRTPTVAARIHALELSVAGEIEVACGASTVRLFAVHLPAPTTSAQQRARTGIDTSVFAGGGAVVAGDFNAVPPDPVLVRLIEGASLKRYGTGPSWPRRIEQLPIGGLRTLGIPIDHVLARGVGVRDVAPFELPGSDHLGFRFTVTAAPSVRGRKP